MGAHQLIYIICISWYIIYLGDDGGTPTHIYILCISWYVIYLGDDGGTPTHIYYMYIIIYYISRWWWGRTHSSSPLPWSPSLDSPPLFHHHSPLSNEKHLQWNTFSDCFLDQHLSWVNTVCEMWLRPVELLILT